MAGTTSGPQVARVFQVSFGRSGKWNKIGAYFFSPPQPQATSCIWIGEEIQLAILNSRDVATQSARNVAFIATDFRNVTLSASFSPLSVWMARRWTTATEISEIGRRKEEKREREEKDFPLRSCLLLSSVFKRLFSSSAAHQTYWGSSVWNISFESGWSGEIPQICMVS